MSDNVFVDTNILLYSRDASEPDKQALASARLDELWENRTGRLSVQVRNE
jgi:predicted nucleic acid-binding protein